MHTGAKNVRAWPFSRMRSCFHIETCRPPESALSIENCRHIWKMAVILAGTKSDSGGLPLFILGLCTSALYNCTLGSASRSFTEEPV